MDVILDWHSIGNEVTGYGWVACWFDEQWQPAMFLSGGNRYTPWGKFAVLQLRSTRCTRRHGRCDPDSAHFSHFRDGRFPQAGRNGRFGVWAGLWSDVEC
jgi:hypothetical protein